MTPPSAAQIAPLPFPASDARKQQAVGGTRFDWAAAVLCTLFQFGVFLDGWAHHHFMELETFFTPWHAVLYSGFFAVSALVAAAFVRNRLKGYSWALAMPAGYELTGIGILVFMLGGVTDMIWHGFFGIEADVEALISPPHLLLGLGAALICTGPLRSGWLRSDTLRRRWMAQLPMVISLGLLLSIFGFFTMYAHPLGRPWPAVGNEPIESAFGVRAADPPIRGENPSSASIAHAVGMAGMLLHTSLTMGTVLLALGIWRWAPPGGSLTIMLLIQAALIGFMRGQLMFVPAAVLAGIAGDAFIRGFHGRLPRELLTRGFAFALPVIYYVLYFVTLLVVKGTWWSIHMVAGSIVLAGIVGWLVSYVSIPPAFPSAASVRTEN